MPSGITHDRITLWILPWIAGGTYGLTHHGELTLIVSGSFLFSGLMFGPDLDIHSLQYKRWGIFRSIWLPYRKLFRHRSLFSHGLIIGTGLRVLYLFFIVALIAIIIVAIAQLFWGFSWNWQQFAVDKLDKLTTEYFLESAAVFFGLELGAMSHSVSDWIVSSRKSRQKKKRRKNKPIPIKQTKSSK
ncbi:MAG: metal-binding protein [Pleurocapsa sp.]